jgi:hypothetical protein
MPFQKGNKEAKKKGKHEKTQQWLSLGESIRTKHADRFNKILDECDDDTFVRLYKDVLEFFEPKLERSEISAKIEEIKPNLPPFMKSYESES